MCARRGRLLKIQTSTKGGVCAFPKSGHFDAAPQRSIPATQEPIPKNVLTLRRGKLNFSRDLRKGENIRGRERFRRGESRNIDSGRGHAASTPIA